MRFLLHVLGTNGALPTHGRNGSGQLLRTERTDVLIDCAEGTQMQLQAAGLGMGKVSTILITHLHGDHYFGLPGLITSLALNDRNKPLRVISPPGLRQRLTPLLELDRFRLPFELEFVEHTATDFGPCAEIGDLEVFSFPLRHRVVTNGYLLREKQRSRNILGEAIEKYGIPYQLIPGIKKGDDYTTEDGRVIANREMTAPAPPPRSFAYCSDTVYFPELADYVRGVDLLYHEATFLHDRAEEARQKGHATAREAATTAVNAGAKCLLMGHYSARYASVDEHEREARETFAASYAAQDLYVYSVPFAGRQA